MRFAAVALAFTFALAVAPGASAAPTISWDVTSGTAGDNGWYRSNVTIRLNVDGATETTCPVVYTFTNSGDHLRCTATQAAEPRDPSSVDIVYQIDKDAPTVTGADLERPPDQNGWYNRRISGHFKGTDATSGIASCTTGAYAGPESATASITGTCRDVAGNVSAVGSFALKFDATPPSTGASAARAPDANGWYNHAVSVSFAATDGGSGVEGCTAPVSYGGPDTSSSTLSGSCTDGAGNSSGASLTLKYDATPPTVAATLDRKPDWGGWYNRPVTVTVAGSDSLSGLAACDPAKKYSGPETDTTRLGGSCRDNAGNTASASVPVRYDSTPPRLRSIVARVGADSAVLRWKQPADTAAVAVVRTPGLPGARSSTVYHGRGQTFRDRSVKAGTVYRYTLTSKDSAGNRAVASVQAVARALYAPAAGGVATAGTLLEWTAAPTATYYNVQLFLRKRKVLTTWTVKTQLRLARKWRLGGKSVTLVPGLYRWYVWPGHGKPAARRYGKLHGSSTFVVR